MAQISNKRLLIYAVIVIIAITLLVVVMMKIIKQNTLCVNDPLVYGASRIYSQSNLEVSCTCTFNDAKYENFIFDRTGMRVLDLQTQTDTFINKLDLNITDGSR